LKDSDGPPKEPSGAQKRKARRLRDEEATRGARADQKVEWAERYRDIGPPPEDGAQRVEWGNRISAEIAYEQLVAPAIRTPSERKLVLEAVRTLGMTAVKALYEERLKRLESKVYKRAGKDADAGAELEESD
jgi:hypothetical protein